MGSNTLYIPGGLHNGQHVLINAIPLQDKCSINFRSGGIRGDIAFHFDIRFNERVVVRNTQTSGSWGGEERDGNFPFTKNSAFFARIQAEPHGFEVYIGNVFHSRYAHRVLPTERIDFVECVNFQVMSLQMSGGGPAFAAYGGAGGMPGMPGMPGMQFPGASYPSPMGGQFPGAGYGGGSMVVYQPGDNKATIPSGLSQGRQIMITATPHNHERFAVNLMYGSDIALHFNPRFNQNKVVLNTLRNGGWESEQHEHHVPFHRGATFTIIIRCEHNHFQILVNGNEFCKFHYRMNELYRINKIELEHLNVQSLQVY